MCLGVLLHTVCGLDKKKKGCIMVYDKAKGVKNPIQKRYNKGRIGELKSSINRVFDNFFNILDCPLTPISDFNLIEPSFRKFKGDKCFGGTSWIKGGRYCC